MAARAAADPGAGFTVTVDDLASTSTVFARRHDVAAGAADSASGALAGTAGMAGDDRVLAAWRGRYDAVASITWLATGAAAGSLHGIAVLLVDTADAYLAADHRSTPGRNGEPERLPRPAAPRRLPPGPRPSTGPTPDPAPPDLAEYWPGGDPPRLRLAADAWNTLAGQLDNTAYRADSEFRTLLAHNHGAAFSAMAQYWARRFTPDAFDPLYNATARTSRIIGQVCQALADLIDTTRRDVENAAIDAAHDTAGAEILARLPPRAAPLVGAKLVGILAPVLVTGGYISIARDQYLQGVHELTERLGPDLEDRLRRAVTTEVPPEENPRNDQHLGLRAADVGEILTTELSGSAWDDLDGVHPLPDQIHVPNERRIHILDGDETGGGHRFGATVPSKDQFPISWTDPRVLANVLSVARAPDGTPEWRPDNTWQLEGMRDGVRIVVVLDANGRIITGYPLPGPGVTRSPP